ncbi:non-specific lipid transfer protein GPI-anchored 14-like isoform X2 [Panicum virgatum]|uniref:non-specific lipid transfer protein GPI-anchored 14-like isoform X2 n=1 Tax=Panicum virgatum TaxID=38727 RepID=UPI0002A9AF8A|nr:non-specific lipid transfer protein GPI-anchored 14-like isoform X2 [Panicum virgatum]
MALARGGRGLPSRAAAAAAAVLVVAALAGVASGDFAADRAECANQLMGLATCLTFVQEKATARAPTPDCCAGLKQVVAASKKCMCVLVKDRDEPALGFKINVTRAMDLPPLCNYPATFSDCPKILGMSPDAPEAEIFKEYARKHESHNGTATKPAAATGAAGGKSATSSSPAGGAGAGSKPGAVVVYLASALVALVSVVLA